MILRPPQHIFSKFLNTVVDIMTYFPSVRGGGLPILDEKPSFLSQNKYLFHIWPAAHRAKSMRPVAITKNAFSILSNKFFINAGKIFRPLQPIFSKFLITVVDIRIYLHAKLTHFTFCFMNMYQANYL